MTKRRTIDLDASRRARSEAKGEEDTIGVLLKGVEFEIPADMPALVLVGMGRLEHKELDGFEDLMVALFGDRATEAMRLGLDLADIEVLITDAYDVGEAPASEA